MQSILAGYARARYNWRRQDRLARRMIANWLGGMVGGVVGAILLLAMDVAGVRTLLWRSEMPITATAMLMGAFAFTFGGLACAAAAMMAGPDDDLGPPRGGRKLKLASRPQYALAETDARRAR